MVFPKIGTEHIEAQEKNAVFLTPSPIAALGGRAENQGVSKVVFRGRGDCVPVGKTTPRKKVVTLPIKT